MSDKFHLNPNTGNPSKCSAKSGNCPFAGDSEHFESMEKARTHFESENADKSLESVRKALKSRRDTYLPFSDNDDEKTEAYVSNETPVSLPPDPRAKPSIEAGLAHARSIVMATGIKANNESVSMRNREEFVDRNKIAWEYRVTLEKLHDSGMTSPEDLIRFAEACDVRAAGAKKATGWTPRARRRNFNSAQMYSYFASTLRKLANGESVDKP